MHKTPEPQESIPAEQSLDRERPLAPDQQRRSMIRSILVGVPAILAASASSAYASNGNHYEYCSNGNGNGKK